MAKKNSNTLSCGTLVFDVEAWLLRPLQFSAFPYFMLVAIEAGGFLRGLLLLLAYPIILCLPGRSMQAKAMTFITFVGLRETEVVRVRRAVLPKFLLEVTALEGLEAVVNAVAATRSETMTTKKKKVVAVCSELPAVMIEAFIREYLCIDVDVVLGLEVSVVWGRYVGIVNDHRSSPCTCLPGTTLTVNETGDDGLPPVTVGQLVGDESRTVHHLCCQTRKYCYTVTGTEKAAWRPLPREKYPKPLVFHDGRLALLPTPSAAIAMYTFLPLGFVLAIIRGIIFTLLPYRFALPLSALTGMHCRLVHVNQASSPTMPAPKKCIAACDSRLFACNHRTLLDPIAVWCALDKPVTAVTYGLSRFSEAISPIRTTQLTRDRDEDYRRMAALLAGGEHVVVCPEGTTCREPYLLRFSPLFAGLAGEVTPVALDTQVDVFFGTSTKPSAKWLDAVYFLMNMRPEYRVEFLETVATVQLGSGSGIDGDGRRIAVANAVQRMIGEALGYELTGLTRKDKYEMMAEKKERNEGWTKHGEV